MVSVDVRRCLSHFKICPVGACACVTRKKKNVRNNERKWLSLVLVVCVYYLFCYIFFAELKFSPFRFNGIQERRIESKQRASLPNKIKTNKQNKDKRGYQHCMSGIEKKN